MTQLEPGRGEPRRRRSRAPRIIGITLAVLVAWVTLMIAGPAPFLILAIAVYVIDLFFDRHRSAERNADLRERRRRSLERAVESGGPSDAPTARHKSPDPNAAEREMFGRRMPGLVRGAWPRGRI